jgi:hypothetical protein
VGQDEDPFASVGSPDFARAKYSPRRCVTKAFQFFDNFSESKADVAVDVFKETELGAQKSNSICDKGPEMSGIFRSKSISGGAEWLAGVAPSKDVHAVTKVFPWEGFKIRPNRCWVHVSRFHFSDQVGTREGFDLTKSDCAQSWEDSFKSKFNAAVSSTKAEVCNCFGSIHILLRLKEKVPGSACKYLGYVIPKGWLLVVRYVLSTGRVSVGRDVQDKLSWLRKISFVLKMGSHQLNSEHQVPYRFCVWWCHN